MTDSSVPELCNDVKTPELWCVPAARRLQNTFNVTERSQNTATLPQHCHKHTQPFHGSLDFVPDNPGEPVSEETFTHSHLSWSSVTPYLLPPSINPRHLPCSVYVPDSLFPQSLSKFSLVDLLAWHLHFILDTFLHPITVFFSQHMPILSQHPFNDLFSRTTWVKRHHKGRTILDFNEARDVGWQWHQLDHMQIILNRDNHASTSSLMCSPAAQPTV